MGLSFKVQPSSLDKQQHFAQVSAGFYSPQCLSALFVVSLLCYICLTESAVANKPFLFAYIHTYNPLGGENNSACVSQKAQYLCCSVQDGGAPSARW